MSLLYTEEQKALLALVREMAENEIKPHVKDADENCLLYTSDAADDLIV